MRFTPFALFFSIILLISTMVVFGWGGLPLGAVFLAIVATIRACRSKAFAIPIVVVLSFFAVNLLFVIDEARSKNEAVRRSACQNNLKQVSLGLQRYHEAHGHFPPAYVPDANGKPMHSWRVLILPYMDRKSLWEQYDFNEPWDGPKNRRLAVEIPDEYRCPCATLNLGKEAGM